MPNSDTPLQHPISQRLFGERSFAERLADGLATHIGSWRFLIIQTCIVVLWVTLNIVGLVLRWDPYPFFLLSLVFSVQAAYVGPVILLSSNRTAKRERIMTEHNHATTDKAEGLVEGLMSELLRNSQATLAIAKHLEINTGVIEAHNANLEAKVAEMQEELAEVEDVVIIGEAEEKISS